MHRHANFWTDFCNNGNPTYVVVLINAKFEACGNGPYRTFSRPNEQKFNYFHSACFCGASSVSLHSCYSIKSWHFNPEIFFICFVLLWDIFLSFSHTFGLLLYRFFIICSSSWFFLLSFLFGDGSSLIFKLRVLMSSGSDLTHTHKIL